MYKYYIKQNIDMKVLKNYGFIEYDAYFLRKYVNNHSTFVDKASREVWYKDDGRCFYRGMKTRINDLFNDDLIRQEGI